MLTYHFVFPIILIRCTYHSLPVGPGSARRESHKNEAPPNTRNAKHDSERYAAVPHLWQIIVLYEYLVHDLAPPPTIWGTDCLNQVVFQDPPRDAVSTRGRDHIPRESGTPGLHRGTHWDGTVKTLTIAQSVV